MNAAFADTFFWIAFTNIRDPAHERVKSFAQPRAIFTIEEVLTEYLNYFSKQGTWLRENAVLNVQSILQGGAIRVIPQSSNSFQKGLTLYRARLDKGYSLTDCISMETMRSLGITDALTNDMHFEQEGFRAVLRQYGASK